MKVNIKKYAAGASMLTYTGLPDFPSQGMPPEAPIEPVDTSLTDGMSGKAITIDAEVFGKKYNEALRQYESMPDHLKRTAQGRMIRSQLKGDWAELNKMERSKAIFDKVVEDKKDAMSEFAVYQGHVVAEDVSTGDIVNMTLSEYVESIQGGEGKFKALTNSEVANLRETDERFAGNDRVIPILKNAISIDKVTENVRKALTNLGSISKGTADASYQEKQVEEGAKIILNNTYTKSSSGEFFQSNEAALKSAGNAMWSMLDNASKDLLRVKAIHEGYKADQIEGAAMGLALGLMKQAYVEKSTIKESELPGGTAKKAGAVGGGSPGEENYFAQMARFNGRREPFGLITGKLDSGRNAKADAVSYNFSILEDEKGDAVTQATLADPRMGGIRSIADFSQVTFGDQRVSFENLQGIVYEGGDMRVMLLPFKVNNDQSISPDFDNAQNYVDAQKEIEAIGKYATKQDRIDAYTSHGFQESELDPEGNPTAEVLRPFIVTEGLTNNGVVHESDLVEMQNNSELEDYYKRIYDTKENKDKGISAPGPGWFLNTKVVRGNIFIPMKDGAKKMAMYGGNTKVLVDRETNFSDYYNQEGPGFNYGSGTTQQIRQGIDLSFEGLNNKQK